MRFAWYLHQCVYGVYGSIWIYMDLYGSIWIYMDLYGSIWLMNKAIPATDIHMFITFWHSLHLASVPPSPHPAAHHDAMKWFADPQKNTLQNMALQSAQSRAISAFVKHARCIQFLVAIYSIYSESISSSISLLKFLVPATSIISVGFENLFLSWAQAPGAT